MKRLLCSALTAGLVLTLASGPVSASPEPDQSVEIRLKDGSKWRGEVGDDIELSYREQHVQTKFAGRLVKAADLYIVIEGNVAGELREKVIFRDDIVSMNRASDSSADATRRQTLRNKLSTVEDAAPESDSERPLGVIVLPLEGFVGGPFRREEIKKVGEKADEYGPGQIIVLLISSNGGSALESQYIAKEIFKLRERHRVVAWVEKAISAGCQTAMCCQEIYFMTEGTAGAVTTWNPGSGQSIKGEDLENALEHLVDIAKKSGYSEYIARSMKTNSAMCSYDKDPETAEITWYGDMSGEFLLSDDDSNLSFTSSSALHCGFSKGTADTEEQLAKLLDLPKWHEVSDYGRNLADKWQKTVKQAEEDIPRLVARRGYWKTSGDAEERIGALIQIDQQFLKWWKRCPNIAQMRLPTEDYLKREIAEFRKQLADMKRGR